MSSSYRIRRLTLMLRLQRTRWTELNGKQWDNEYTWKVKKNDIDAKFTTYKMDKDLKRDIHLSNNKMELDKHLSDNNAWREKVGNEKEIHIDDSSVKGVLSLKDEDRQYDGSDNKKKNTNLMSYKGEDFTINKIHLTKNLDGFDYNDIHSRLYLDISTIITSNWRGRKILWHPRKTLISSFKINGSNWKMPQKVKANMMVWQMPI